MSSHGNHDLGNQRMRRNVSTYYSSHSGNHYYTNHQDNALGNGSYGDDYYYDYYGDFIDYDYPEDRATTTINSVSILILFKVKAFILSFCEVCTSVYQPLVPSIFQLDQTSAPQYDDKSLDTVYYFIIWFYRLQHSQVETCTQSLYVRLI